MNNTRQLKLIITASITVLIAGLLIWQHFNGGVPSHSFLQRDDFPEMSNWWGLLILPVLSWILLGRIESRLSKEGNKSLDQKPSYQKIIALFIAGLVWGIIIAVSFTNNYKTVLDLVPLVFLILSFFIPIFYSEFILGFILGMTYTLGAILPTIFVLVFAAVGFLIYRFLRPLLLKLFLMFMKKNEKV
jgi:hypothetical protein